MDPSTFRRLVAVGDAPAVRAAIESEPALAALADDDGTTPLHLSARHGRAEVATLLLEAGADIDARTGSADGNRTALHDSYEFGQPELTELLLAAGADYDIAVAAALGDTDRVAELLAERPDLVDDPSTGLSPLGWAGYGQDPAMVGYLIGRGATLGDELCCPCGTGNTAIIQAFLDAGADPNALSDGWGARPLHVAAAMPYSTDSTAAVELLLTAGADPNATAADGATTALDLARAKRAGCSPETDTVRIAGYDRLIAVLEQVS